MNDLPERYRDLVHSRDKPDYAKEYLCEFVAPDWHPLDQCRPAPYQHVRLLIDDDGHKYEAKHYWELCHDGRFHRVGSQSERYPLDRDVVAWCAP